MSLSDEDKKIGIIGSGLIGTSFAVIFSKSGYNVSVYDIKEEQLEKVEGNARKSLEALYENNLLPNQDVNNNNNDSNNEEEKNRIVNEILERITTTTNLEDCLEGSFYVQECVPEVFELKKQIFEKVDPMLDPTVIFASSTSNMPSSSFTTEIENRHRVLVCHPVNPPMAIPLIEVVPSEFTSEEIFNKTFTLMQRVKMEPIRVKETDGFCLNRLQYALLAEAYRLVEDGVASPEDVDKCIRFGLARRWSFMGPFCTIDLNAPNGISDYCERYQSGILNVVHKQDNSREWKEETIKKIEDNIRETTQTQDQLPERTVWRNKRLLALESHMQQQPK
eukprot:TRINITY_DN10841_c0_g1_i1.p1 TRINITY_DN10841_c0_g1~~TRINITY_DN10841_c0_g1_i1.p1  ORF type:complete len:335 (-),score=130.73 TRINITY_DN10841_c0_g1_i1:62-1066(-)